MVNFAQTPRPATSYRFGRPGVFHRRPPDTRDVRSPETPAGEIRPGSCRHQVRKGAWRTDAEQLRGPRNGRQIMSLGLILIIILVIFLIGGFSGRFGGYGYGYGHGGIGVIGIILIILLVLVLTGRL